MTRVYSHAFDQTVDQPDVPFDGKEKPPPLTLADWLTRDLPAPDLILPWLSTTSRVQINGPTGTGKTMFGVGLCMGMSAGCGFLHWSSIRPARTLLIDGEMSRRLLQQRLAAEAERLDVTPEGMHILSHEDIEGFAPLNTPEGQAQIERQIEGIGALDLIMFDNIMCLIAGDMKDEEGWRQTLPWVRSLTRRSIGQIWLHHTGHVETKGYVT
jgi:RecA-family ATPase